jgi:selenocysteine lyase/cysteine desulfurase
MKSYERHTLDVKTDLSVKYRVDFPVFEHVTYLNSCSQGAIAKSVRQSFTTYLNSLELHGSTWGDWAGQQEKVRALLEKLFNVTPGEMAVTTSTSAAVSSLASALDFSSKRNRIVTTDNEFPAIGQIWHAQERRGAKVTHVPSRSDNTVDVEKLIKEINEETLLVSITLVCFRNGALTDIAPIIEAAKKAGALVLLDSYQGAGAMNLDLARIGADFVVGGVLKYMLGAPGVGYMYTNAETTKNLIPSSTGWFAAKDIFKMGIHEYDPATDARRFESGTPPIPSLYPAVAGLEYLLKVGMEEIVDYVSHLHEALRAGIEEIGGSIATPAHAHAAMLAVRSTDENALVAALESEKIITSCRDGNLRISPHFYNNMEDIDLTIKALSKHKSLLKTP